MNIKLSEETEKELKIIETITGNPVDAEKIMLQALNYFIAGYRDENGDVRIRKTKMYPSQTEMVTAINEALAAKKKFNKEEFMKANMKDCYVLSTDKKVMGHPYVSVYVEGRIVKCPFESVDMENIIYE